MYKFIIVYFDRFLSHSLGWAKQRNAILMGAIIPGIAPPGFLGIPV